MILQQGRASQHVLLIIVDALLMDQPVLLQMRLVPLIRHKVQDQDNKLIVQQWHKQIIHNVDGLLEILVQQEFVLN